MSDLPQPVPEPAPVPRPGDLSYPGRICLHADVRDVTRRIFQVREIIPVAQPGTITLLFPERLPGYHAPQAPIELFAGAEDQRGRHGSRVEAPPVNVHAFAVDVPEGVEAIEARFQFLSPAD